MTNDDSQRGSIKAYECTIRPLDFTFFATSEQNQRSMVNAEVIHNYALMYALSRNVRSLSGNIVVPDYRELFDPRNIWFPEYYMTPAVLKTAPRKVVQTYNSTSEAIWYGLAMDKKGRLNFPRMGGWEKLVPWTKADGWAEYVSILLHWGKDDLGSRETVVRVGKKRSPSRLFFRELELNIGKVEDKQIVAFNPLDCDESKLSIRSYKLVVIPPSPLVTRARGSGILIELQGVSEKLSETGKAYLPIPKHLENRVDTASR